MYPVFYVATLMRHASFTAFALADSSAQMLFPDSQMAHSLTTFKSLLAGHLVRSERPFLTTWYAQLPSLLYFSHGAYHHLTHYAYLSCLHLNPMQAPGDLGFALFNFLCLLLCPECSEQCLGLSQ